MVAIAPTYAPTGDEHEFNVTVTSRDDPETSDNQEITAIPIYNQQNGGDKVLLVDANFGKNNGYNNYYDVDKIDQRLRLVFRTTLTMEKAEVMMFIQYHTTVKLVVLVNYIHILLWTS